MKVPYSTKLPNEPIFRRLVENNKTVHNVIIHDPSYGLNAKYPQLLHDILALRQRLYECLPVSMFDEKGRMKGDNPYILILSRGNYEFIVAAFSILALGGALVPLGKFMKTLLFPRSFFLFKIMRVSLTYISSERTQHFTGRSPTLSNQV